MSKYIVLLFVILVSTFFSFTKNFKVTLANTTKIDSYASPFYLAAPFGFPKIVFPSNNPLTVEVITLGHKLFYDPILSFDNPQYFGSCQNQNFKFTESALQFSKGITGEIGTRNAMPIMNLAREKKFFWDGGAATQKDQVISPFENPIEIHETLTNVLNKLNNHFEYPKLFKKAFGTDSVTTQLLTKAVAQFERTIISANSKYDKYIKGEANLTLDELKGKELYENQNKGDCFHCHSMGSTFTDFKFRNNGLDSVFKGGGRNRITLSPLDIGKFKTLLLGNIELTAPYLYDGSFTTLAQVIEHYNTGFVKSPTLKADIALAKKGRLNDIENNKLFHF